MLATGEYTVPSLSAKHTQFQVEFSSPSRYQHSLNSEESNQILCSTFRPAQLFPIAKRKDSFSRTELSTPQGQTQACSLGVNTPHGKYSIKRWKSSKYQFTHVRHRSYTFCDKHYIFLHKNLFTSRNKKMTFQCLAADSRHPLVI